MYFYSVDYQSSVRFFTPGRVGLVGGCDAFSAEEHVIGVKGKMVQPCINYISTYKLCCHMKY